MANTVKRGYVVVYRDRINGCNRVTAVVSQSDALALKRRVGGSIVSAVGMEYRLVQGLRSLVSPASAVALVSKGVK